MNETCLKQRLFKYPSGIILIVSFDNYLLISNSIVCSKVLTVGDKFRNRRTHVQGHAWLDVWHLIRQHLSQ